MAGGDKVTACVVLSLAPYLSQMKAWSQGLQAFIQPWGLDRITTTIKITIKEDDTFLPRLRGRYHDRGFMTILL